MRTTLIPMSDTLHAGQEVSLLDRDHPVCGEKDLTHDLREPYSGIEHTRSTVKNIKQYPAETNTRPHELGKATSDTLHVGQEVRLVGKDYPVCDEEDSRGGKLWIYEARYKVEKLRRSGSNKAMIEGTSTRTLLRIVCSSSVGKFNELTSLCEEHIIEEYLIKDVGWPHVLGRVMNDTPHTDQKLRYVVKEAVGDMDRFLSMSREQSGDSNGHISTWEEHTLSPAEDAKQKDGKPRVHIIKDTACFHVLRRIMSDTLRNTKERLARTYELVDTYNIGGDTKAAQKQQQKLEPIFNAAAKDEKSPNIDTLAIKEPKYNLEPKKTYEKASLQSAATKDEKFPNIDTLAIKYNLEPKRIYEKASFQSAAAKDEKVPNIDILAIKYNLEPKRTYEKASFQSAATKDEKLPNIDTLAGKHNPEPKKTGDQYEQTGTQSPRNWSILTGWWTVPRSLVNERTARDQRKRVEPMLESWDEMNAKALTRKYCVYIFSLFWTAALILP